MRSSLSLKLVGLRVIEQLRHDLDHAVAAQFVAEMRSEFGKRHANSL